MQKTLTRIFYAGFALLWGWIFINSVMRWSHNGLAALCVGLGMTAVFWALDRYLLTRLDRVSQKCWKWGFGAVFALYAVAFCWMAWLMAEVPIMDHEVVLRTLPSLMETGRFGPFSGYYIVCNNNLGLALLLGGWYKLASIFGFAPGNDLAGVLPGIVLNCIAILGSVALLCKIARRVFGSNRSVALTFLLAAGFAPFWLYGPCFYSDTLSLPFGLLAVLAFTYWAKEERPAVRLALLAGMAASAFVGFAIKGSVVVVLAALVIQFFLQKPPMRALQSAAALVLVFAAMLFGYKVMQRGGIIDWTDEDKLTLPLSLWFCYGSHDEGNYSQEDVDLATSVDTLAEREELIAQRIRQNYASYSPAELAEFMTKKAAITWGDGLYNAEEFLETQQRANWTHFFIIRGQPGYMPLVYYCQGYLYMLQLLMTLFLVSRIKDGEPNTLTLCAMSVLGLVIFLSFWETKARYAFQFTPFLLLLAAAGVLWLNRKTKEKS